MLTICKWLITICCVLLIVDHSATILHIDMPYFWFSRVTPATLLGLGLGLALFALKSQTFNTKKSEKGEPV